MDKVYLVVFQPSPDIYSKTTSTEQIIVCIASSYDAAVMCVESDASNMKRKDNIWISEGGSTCMIVEKHMNRILPMSGDVKLAKMLI